MRVNVKQAWLLTLVSAVTVVTTSSYKVPPLSRSAVSHGSAVLHTSKLTKSDASCLRNRGSRSSLKTSVEDYGPQFASYLQNDVSVFTVGNLHSVTFKSMQA